MSYPENPMTRQEQYLDAIARGETDGLPAIPNTRLEMYLDYIARNGGGGGGGGTGSSVVAEKFDDTKDYNPGSYVIRSGKLYTNSNAVSAGDFDPTEWTEITIGEELSDLNSRIGNQTATGTTATLTAGTTVFSGTPTALTVTLPEVADGQEYCASFVFKAGANFALTEVVPDGCSVEYDAEPVWDAGTIYMVTYLYLHIDGVYAATVIGR